MLLGICCISIVLIIVYYYFDYGDTYLKEIRRKNHEFRRRYDLTYISTYRVIYTIFVLFYILYLILIIYFFYK